MKRKYRIIFLAICACLLILLFTGKKISLNQFGSDQKSDYLSLFSEVADIVKTQYVEDVVPEAKFPGAFSSELTSMDRFSAYLDESQSRIYRLVDTGNFCLTGIFGIRKNGYFAITDVMPGLPADRKGIKIGDIIKSINGKNIFSLSFWEMYLNLLSEKPAEIEVEYEKNGSQISEKVFLKTEPLLLSPRIRPVKKDVFFVALNRFDTQHVNFLREKMLQTENRKWIIDLRRYSGGDYLSFLELTKIFIHKKMNLRILTKKGTENFVIGSDDFSANRCVFIINGSTILYAELLAQLLKSNQVVLIGENTPGFSPFLKQFFLSDGSSILLTAGIFNLDSNMLLNSGVKPDFSVQTHDEEKLLPECVRVLNQL
jgi:carboxyl-terminal processing protease